MTRLPRVSGRAVVSALRRGGYALSHVGGSQHYLRKSGADSLVVVPVHGNRTLPLGTLRAILRQAQLTSAELDQLLRS